MKQLHREQENLIFHLEEQIREKDGIAVTMTGESKKAQEAKFKAEQNLQDQMQLTEEKMKQIQKLKGDLETEKSVH